MAQNSGFRVSLFGGHKKADVEEYVKNLEHEMEMLKMLNRKDREDLVRRLDESEGTTLRLKEDNGQWEQEREDLREAAARGEQELSMSRKELELKAQELTESKEELEQKAQELTESKEELEQKAQE
ncbi:MAG: hypothetical protein LUC90_02880, partial [Lachnospiraceae bacterium]|nr:hypothetical protein [Lachnospiraceae bacterium]